MFWPETFRGSFEIKDGHGSCLLFIQNIVLSSIGHAGWQRPKNVDGLLAPFTDAGRLADINIILNMGEGLSIFVGEDKCFSVREQTWA